jgi:hypothetical protein
MHVQLFLVFHLVYASTYMHILEIRANTSNRRTYAQRDYMCVYIYMYIRHPFFTCMHIHTCMHINTCRFTDDSLLANVLIWLRDIDDGLVVRCYHTHLILFRPCHNRICTYLRCCQVFCRLPELSTPKTSLRCFYRAEIWLCWSSERTQTVTCIMHQEFLQICVSSFL